MFRFSKMRTPMFSIATLFVVYLLLISTAPTLSAVVRVDSPHHGVHQVSKSMTAVEAFNEGVAVPKNRVMSDEFGRYVVPDENGECSFMPEIVMVQDISGSYEDDLVNLQAQMPELFKYFEDEFQGNVKFAVTTFIDKPNPGLGDPNDYCARVELPLAPVNTPEAMARAAATFGRLTAGGGGRNDWLEGADVGMMRIAASKSVGWSPDTYDPITGKPIVRILVVATDAAMHEAGWHAQEVGLDLPANSLLSKRDELDANANYGCDAMDYPEGRDIGVVFKERGIMPIILTGQAWFWTTPEQTNRAFFGQYRNILKKYGQSKGPWSDFDTGLAAYYADFLKDQVRVDGIVQNIDNTSSNFVDVFKFALREVSELACRLPPTTTESPSSSGTEVTDPTLYPPHPSTKPTDVPPSTSFLSSTASSPEGSSTSQANGSSTSQGNGSSTSQGNESSTSQGNESSTSSSSGGDGSSSSSSSTSAPTSSSDGDGSTSSSPEGASTSQNNGSSTSQGNGDGSSTSTGNSGGGNGSTTTTTTTTEGSSGGSSAIIIGSAAGGAAVAVAAVAGVLVKKFGFFGFGGSPPAPQALTHDVDNVEIQQDREQVEGVTGDLFA